MKLSGVKILWTNIVPEHGSTESRLQAARANGDIEGGPVVDRSEPFNWKEAQSKKKR